MTNNQTLSGMSISKEKLNEFKCIYLKHFGEKLSDKEAYQKGMVLLSVFKVIYKPIPIKN